MITISNALCPIVHYAVTLTIMTPSFCGHNPLSNSRLKDIVAGKPPLWGRCIGIIRILTHASWKGYIIHADYSATIDCLQHNMPNDIYLLTTILTIAQCILSQGGCIVLNWVIGQIIIWGNVIVHQLAALGKGELPNDMVIYPRRALSRCRVEAAGHASIVVH